MPTTEDGKVYYDLVVIADSPATDINWHAGDECIAGLLHGRIRAWLCAVRYSPHKGQSLH